MIEKTIRKEQVAAAERLGHLQTPAEERFDRITRVACRAFNTPIAMISLIEREHFWLKSKQGLIIGEIERDNSFGATTVTHAATLVVQDALMDSRFGENTLVKNEPFVRFYAGCPLVAPKGEIIGVLAIMDPVPRDFSSEDIELLRDLARITESELQFHQQSEAQQELMQERDRLKRSAMLDPLTGAWHKDAILQILKRAGALQTERGALTVMRVDVDHLGAINHRFGFEGGSAVLHDAAQLLRRSVQPSDAVGRLKDDEFLLVLLGCDEHKARVKAHRIVNATNSTSALYERRKIPYRVSVGYAISPPLPSGETAKLLEAAEFALQRAKGRGGNRAEKY